MCVYVGLCVTVRVYFVLRACVASTLYKINPLNTLILLTWHYNKVAW